MALALDDDIISAFEALSSVEPTELRAAAYRLDELDAPLPTCGASCIDTLTLIHGVLLGLAVGKLIFG